MVATPQARLRFDRVSKAYDAPQGDGHPVQAVRDVDLEVPAGSSIGIIGPNGAGKSTLLRLAMGVTVPDAGTIRRRGRTAAVLELGIGLHPELTGLENLYFAGALLGLSRREVQQHRPALVEFSGLGDHIGRPVKHYSSGMLARLGFSIAAHAGAELLLIDEVLSVGDQEFRQRSLRRLQELHHEGTTIVAVTHDLSMMAQLCERAVLLVDGAVAEDGHAASVAARYLGIDDDQAGSLGSIALRGGALSVPAGEPWHLEADIELRHHHPRLTGRIDMGVPNTALGIDGDGMQAYASAPLHLAADGPGTHRLSLTVDTTFLPESSFVLRVSIDAPDRMAPLSASIPARIERSSSSAMRLHLPASLVVSPQGEARP